jgi:hypothetical protein
MRRLARCQPCKFSSASVEKTGVAAQMPPWTVAMSRHDEAFALPQNGRTAITVIPDLENNPGPDVPGTTAKSRTSQVFDSGTVSKSFSELRRTHHVFKLASRAHSRRGNRQD